MTIFRRSALVIALLVLFATSINTGFAQEGGRGLQISPTRSEITSSPGEVKTVKIFLKNISDTDMVATAEIHDFESNNEGGEPQIIVDLSHKSDYSIKSFVRNLSDVELKAGETKEVALDISMPGDIAPGAYFGAVRYTATPKSDEATSNTPQVGLTASVATLILIEVTGDVQESIRIENIGVGRGDKTGKLFISFPNRAAISIANTGNSFAKPFGRIAIMKGANEVYSYELNKKDPRSNVLPKSTRIFRDDVKNINSFGKYTIIASVAPNQGGEVLTISSTFWVIPLWIIILMAIVALLLVLGIIYLRIRLKSTKRHNHKKR